jgi:hypothetical protein
VACILEGLHPHESHLDGYFLVNSCSTRSDVVAASVVSKSLGLVQTPSLV